MKKQINTGIAEVTGSDASSEDTVSIQCFNCLQQAQKEEINGSIFFLQECRFDEISEHQLESVSKTYMTCFFGPGNGWNEDYTFNNMTYEVFDKKGKLIRNLEIQKAKFRQEYHNIGNRVFMLFTEQMEAIGTSFIMIDDFGQINNKKGLMEKAEDLSINHGKYAYIDQLFVHPNFRKLGIGKNLKQKMEDYISMLLQTHQIRGSITRNLPKNIQPYKMNMEKYRYEIIYTYSDGRVILFRS